MPALWQDCVRLDDGFWKSLREHPVPVREDPIWFCWGEDRGSRRSPAIVSTSVVATNSGAVTAISNGVPVTAAATAAQNRSDATGRGGAWSMWLRS